MYQQLTRILHNRFLTTAIIISILIFILTLLLSPRPSQPTTSLPLPNSNNITQLRAELSNLSEVKRQEAIAYYDLVSDNFPIYYPDFRTSVGISTEIHIFHFEDDPLELTRFEISGLSYVNKNELDESKNPNVTAFKESFQKGLSLLTEAQVDPKKLIFIYGDRDYVQSSASYWVDKLGLLR